MNFNVDEVFGMAERIEMDAAEFYTKAADIHADHQAAAFLRALAKMEYEHRDTFAAMRKTLAPKMRQLPDEDPYPKATIFLDTFADAHGGEGTLSMAAPLTASDRLDDLVKKGIAFERHTILFYLALKDLVPEGRGKDQIGRIIDEEKQHVVALTEKLAELKSC